VAQFKHFDDILPLFKSGMSMLTLDRRRKRNEIVGTNMRINFRASNLRQRRKMAFLKLLLIEIAGNRLLQRLKN
jgi:hypothetical protein